MYKYIFELFDVSYNRENQELNQVDRITIRATEPKPEVLNEFRVAIKSAPFLNPTS